MARLLLAPKNFPEALQRLPQERRYGDRRESVSFVRLLPHPVSLHDHEESGGLQRPPEDEYSDPEGVKLEEYLKDLFDSRCSEFHLSFETGELIDALE